MTYISVDLYAAEREEYRCNNCGLVSLSNLVNYGPKRETLCDECGIYWKKYSLMRLVNDETLLRNSWVESGAHSVMKGEEMGEEKGDE